MAKKTIKDSEIDARKYMQLAIDEMRKTIVESRNDGKATPKVGAVLISGNGELLATAYRGATPEGDHAEYTLLDRKLRDKNVTEGFYLPPWNLAPKMQENLLKVECAQRIVNARIKKVYVGIEDPDPTVARKGLKFLEESGIEVEMFDKDLQDIVEAENRQFLKGSDC